MRLGSRGSEDRALLRSLVRRAELEGHRREGFVVFCSDLFEDERVLNIYLQADERKHQ